MLTERDERDIELDVIHDETSDDPELTETTLEVQEQGLTFRQSILELKRKPIDFCCTFIWSFFIGLLIFIIVAYPICIVIFYDDGSWVYTKAGLGNLQLAREQQIDCPTSLFAPRQYGLDQVWYYFQQISGIDPFASGVKHHVGIRSQFKYNPWNCTDWEKQEQYMYSEYQSHYYKEIYDQRWQEYTDKGKFVSKNDHDDLLSDMELRVRNWLYVIVGDDDRTSTIDAKQHQPTQIECYNLDFTPAPDQSGTEKLEQDVHQCDYEFSRKAKVEDVPYYPTFETCRDVLALWPNSLPNLPEYLYDNIVERKTHSENIWFEELREGTDFDTGIKWRLTMTMEYATFSQALEGRVPPEKGSVEISLRTWSPDGGTSPWNPKLRQIVNHWYHELYFLFGKDFETFFGCA